MPKLFATATAHLLLHPLARQLVRPLLGLDFLGTANIQAESKVSNSTIEEEKIMQKTIVVVGGTGLAVQHPGIHWAIQRHD